MDKNNGFGKLKRYYKYNRVRIFLIGILLGAVFMAIHVVVDAIDSQKFSIKYIASITMSYNVEMDGTDITSKECYDIITSDEVASQIKAYLGEYVTYDEFLENLKFEVDNGQITTYYTDGSQIRAKRVVSTVSGKLCNGLYNQDRVEYIGRNGKIYAEEIKVFEESRLKIGLTYFTEIGILLGWLLGYIIFTIIYYGNGRIKTKANIEDELHLVVLTEVPYVESISK